MPKKSAVQGAKAQLEELDVREVSIVDKPAIKRTWLIVKNAEGELPPDQEVISMARAIPADEAANSGFVANQTITISPQAVSLVEKLVAADGESALEILGVATEEIPVQPEEPPAQEEQQGEQKEEVIKDAKGVAEKTVNAGIELLLSEVNKMKAGKADDSLPQESSDNLNRVGELVSSFIELAKPNFKIESNASTTRIEKSGDALALANSGLELLMKASNALKDPAAKDVADDTLKDLCEVAKSFSIFAPVKKEQEVVTPAPQIEIFLRKTSDEHDPEFVMKAGAKMKKSRLSSFRQAVALLTDLLKELDGMNNEQKKPEPTTKTDQPALAPQKEEQQVAPQGVTKSEIAELIKGELTSFGQALNQKLDGIKGDVEKVTKRVDEIETARPAGNEQDPPTEVKKNEGGFWSNIFA